MTVYVAGSLEMSNDKSFTNIYKIFINALYVAYFLANLSHHIKYAFCVFDREKSLRSPRAEVSQSLIKDWDTSYSCKIALFTNDQTHIKARSID